MEQLKIPYIPLKNLESKFKQTPSRVWTLKSNYPKKMPKIIKAEFLTDKNEFEEVIKYGESFLKNPEKVISEIAYNEEKEVVEGSRPKFVVLYGKFLRHIKDKNRKPITAGQLEDFLYMIKDKFWVDDGLHLTGVGNINHDESEAIYNDFLKRGIGKINLNGYLKNSIRMDLSNLDLDENGLFRLMDNSIWCETNKLIKRENYKFKERDKFGIPIENKIGKRTCYVVNVNTELGLFRCSSDGYLDSNVGYENLCNSDLNDRVVLANSRNE